MFDVGPSELLLIVVVAVVVIGPKDLPRALYKIGQVIGKAKSMARHFRTGVDAMIREAELDELQKQWASENERIMANTALTEPDGVMTPLTDESGQPVGAAAQLPAPGEAASVDDAPGPNGALAPDDARAPDDAGLPDKTARPDAAGELADAPLAPAKVESAAIGSAAAMPAQPRLPLDAAPDDAPRGSSTS